MSTITLNNVWETTLVVATLLAAILIPARLVTGPPLANYFFFEALLTVLFAVDLLVTWKGGKSAGKERSIFPLWFTADAIAAFPFVFFSPLPVLHLFRLFKLGRVFRIGQQYWRRNRHQSLILRLAVFVVGLGIATHWLACGWLALRGMNPGVDGITNYISSLYFCITTLTTVGFGDVTPANNIERLFVIGMMIFGVAVYGFAIGSVASLLTKMNPAKTHYVENMEKLHAFMKYKSLPLDLRRRLTQYYEYLWEQRLGYDESSILTSLPPSLKMELSLFLKRDIIQKVPLFNGASEGFIKDIALQITPVVYLPGDFVVRAGEPGDEMYLVSRGELEVLSRDGLTVFTMLRDGDFFGEIALVLKQPRSASVRAITYCDLYRLDRELFERVLSNYPEVAAQIRERAMERQTRN